MAQPANLAELHFVDIMAARAQLRTKQAAISDFKWKEKLTHLVDLVV
jgi:hypothetical protein